MIGRRKKSVRSPGADGAGSDCASAFRYNGTRRQRGRSSSNRENCAASQMSSGVANIIPARMCRPPLKSTAFANRQGTTWERRHLAGVFRINCRRDGGAPREAFNRSLHVFLAFARGKFKRDLALVIHDEIGRKRLPGLGNELVDQIGLARGQQLLRLRRLNRLLQNLPADLEFARLDVRLRFFAQVTRFRVEDLAAAPRTFAQRLFAGEINLRQRFPWRPGLWPCPCASRGGNSNAVPPSLTTRNALNARLFFLEMNFVSKSVLPSASSFFTCSGEISCCRMILPVRNVQVLSGPVAFSQM